jgi:hypothetical protein
MRDSPPARTAIVRPPAWSAVAWANPSIPRARPRGRGRHKPAHESLTGLLVIPFTAKDVGLTEREALLASVADELRRDPSQSDRGLEGRLGVNHHKVADIRRELVQAGEIPTVARRTKRHAG